MKKLLMFIIIASTTIFIGTVFTRMSSANNDTVVEDHLKSAWTYNKYLESYGEEALRLRKAM